MTEDDTKERDEVARKNKQALIYLLAEHPEIFIATRDFANWRPTVREIGTIPGVWESVEILCTDGLIAWFLNHDPDRFGEVLVGHIQHFSGEVATLYSCQSDKPIKERANKPRKKGESLLSRALALLSCNVRGNEQDNKNAEV
jgi:hypothetical protein